MQPSIATLMDPSSKQVLATVSPEGREKLQNVGRGLVNAGNAMIGTMQDNLDLQGLLQGLLVPNEAALLQGKTLAYKFAIFTNAESDQIETQFHTGVLLLTNMRLLFLSVSGGRNLAIQQHQAGARFDVSYAVSDKCSFFPIPLENTKHVSMFASSSSGQNSSVTKTVEESCCCLKQTKWLNSKVDSEQTNERFISMGVLMPPWNKRMTLKVNFTPDTPLSQVRDLVAAIQGLQRATSMPAVQKMSL